MTTIITLASYAVTRTLSYSLVMTSSQQYIVWTAVLLYHRLKVAARIHNRYRLSSKIISTALIQRLALYYKKSTASILKIVGVNGRNTKRIYKRLVGHCKSFEILNCIYKRLTNVLSMIIQVIYQLLLLAPSHCSHQERYHS